MQWPRSDVTQLIRVDPNIILRSVVAWKPGNCKLLPYWEIRKNIKNIQNMSLLLFSSLSLCNCFSCCYLRFLHCHFSLLSLSLLPSISLSLLSLLLSFSPLVREARLLFSSLLLMSLSLLLLYFLLEMVKISCGKHIRIWCGQVRLGKQLQMVFSARS